MQKNDIRILIVDDSCLQRDTIKSTLKADGYNNIYDSADGYLALDLAKNIYFNLIITDINMPCMDGFAFVENVRSLFQYKTTPIAVLSVEHDSDTKNICSKLGISAIFKKPMNSDMLLKYVNSILPRLS